MIKPKLTVLSNLFTIHKLQPDSEISQKVFSSNIFWIAKTPDEISIVCDSNISINNSTSEADWKAIKVVDKLEFSMVGIISDISSILAKAGISIFAISTYDTDYILIKSSKLDIALKVLKNNSYIFQI